MHNPNVKLSHWKKQNRISQFWMTALSQCISSCDMYRSHSCIQCIYTRAYLCLL